MPEHASEEATALDECGLGNPPRIQVAAAQANGHFGVAAAQATGHFGIAVDIDTEFY